MVMKCDDRQDLNLLAILLIKDHLTTVADASNIIVRDDLYEDVRMMHFSTQRMSLINVFNV